MILLVNICKEIFHELEFVRPIKDILMSRGIKFKIVHYKELKKIDIDNAKRIIICGTSIKDNNFLKNMKSFSWITGCNKPILGICGGMQIIGMSFRNTHLEKKKQIGMYGVDFEKEFFGLQGRVEVYELHSRYIIPNLKDFEIFAVKQCPQAIKHKTMPYYGVLFHPEVRNKTIIEEFCRL
ncbi:hypothetical protein J4466_04430 [Candidatus Pacearchaeota archaeon]|nr:hypothetical protein [Candidatus Pacearchaeota archaeon]